MFNIKKQITSQKHIIYFGILIIIPDTVNYIVTDELGYVLGFSGEPTIPPISIENTRPTWKFQNQYPIRLTKIQFNGDWKESLMKIPN